MSEGSKLEDLSNRLGDTLKRIDQLEAKPTVSARLRRHFRHQGGNIVNALLAACLFTVAVGKMSQQHQHEEELQQCKDEKETIIAENVRLRREAVLFHYHSKNVQQQIEAELQSGGWRLAPVASRIRSILVPPQDVPSDKKEVSVEQVRINQMALRQFTATGQTPGEAKAVKLLHV